MCFVRGVVTPATAGFSGQGGSGATWLCNVGSGIFFQAAGAGGGGANASPTGPTLTDGAGGGGSGFAAAGASGVVNNAGTPTGNGLIILSYALTPPNKDACKNGGWRNYVDDQGRPFTSQGRCVDWAVHHTQGVPMRTHLRFAALVSVVLFIIAIASASARAQPAAASAELGQNATLVAKGAAIDVPVVYSCSPDTANGTMFLFVTERVSGNHAASGIGEEFDSQFDMTCDGSAHTAVVTVTPTGSDAFHYGTDVVSGSFEACDVNGSCIDVPISGTIAITKK